MVRVVVHHKARCVNARAGAAELRHQGGDRGLDRGDRDLPIEQSNLVDLRATYAEAAQRHHQLAKTSGAELILIQRCVALGDRVVRDAPPWRPTIPVDFVPGTAIGTPGEQQNLHVPAGGHMFGYRHARPENLVIGMRDNQNPRPTSHTPAPVQEW
jgi:hypothetical protein